MNGRHFYEALDMDRELFPRKLKDLVGLAVGQGIWAPQLKKTPTSPLLKNILFSLLILNLTKLQH
jgi:hypothetical protein